MPCRFEDVAQARLGLGHAAQAPEGMARQDARVDVLLLIEPPRQRGHLAGHLEDMSLIIGLGGFLRGGLERPEVRAARPGWHQLGATALPCKRPAARQGALGHRGRGIFAEVQPSQHL